MLTKIQQAITENASQEQVYAAFQAEVKDIVENGKNQLGKLEKEILEYQVIQVKEKLTKDHQNK